MANLNVSGQFESAAISSLKSNQVFVFGSNTEGKHGEGAAQQAVKYGAVMGQARGIMGQSYGIVTKDLNKGVRSVPLTSIEQEVKEFLAYANSQPNKEFLVTPIGVGLTGYTVQEIAPMFQDYPENVILPQEFLDNLVPFLAPEEIKNLMSVLEDEWATLSMSEQVLMLNEMARQAAGDKVSALVVKTRQGKLVFPHVTYLSKMSSFSPLLALPHSGQGFSTMEKIGIQHPAVLTFEVTIGELRVDEEGDHENLDKEARNKLQAAKIAKAKKILKLKHGKPGEAKSFKVGETIPEGEMLYHLDYGDGRIVAGPKLSKQNFHFVVEAVPSVEDTDFTLVGNPDGATRAKVQVRVKGHWYSTSEAEKFAAMLTKLCVDKMPRTEKPEDLLKGGILLYEDNTSLPLEEMALQILEEKVQACPLTDVGSGQETQKGAPTAEPASAFLKALTGKSVLREETLRHQKVNGEEVEMGYIVWDTDEFVEFRNVWNESSIHKGVWVRWVDEWMHEVLKESTKKKAGDFYSFPCIHGGFYWFHRTEVRVELAPLTLETATQKECLSGPKGSMFSELLQTLGQIGQR
jgi:hypothetical protein